MDLTLLSAIYPMVIDLARHFRLKPAWLFILAMPQNEAKTLEIANLPARLPRWQAGSSLNSEDRRDDHRPRAANSLSGGAR